MPLESPIRFAIERSLEGKGNELKESVIAVEVFGRKAADYDPKLDSIVRTEAGRLRSRLAEYYAGHGSADRIVIELPKGGYAPVFRSNGGGEPQNELPTVRRWPKLALVATLVVVLIAAAGWWWRDTGTNEPIAVAVLPLENLVAISAMRISSMGHRRDHQQPLRHRWIGRPVANIVFHVQRQATERSGCRETAQCGIHS
jgi:hypothetical protein